MWKIGIKLTVFTVILIVCVLVFRHKPNAVSKIYGTYNSNIINSILGFVPKTFVEKLDIDTISTNGDYTLIKYDNGQIGSSSFYYYLECDSANGFIAAPLHYRMQNSKKESKNYRDYIGDIIDEELFSRLIGRCDNNDVKIMKYIDLLAAVYGSIYFKISSTSDIDSLYNSFDIVSTDYDFDEKTRIEKNIGSDTNIYWLPFYGVIKIDIVHNTIIVKDLGELGIEIFEI